MRIDDFSSPTHARGHADPQSGSEHPGVVRPAGLTLRPLLQSVTRAVGTGADSYLPGLFDERKEASDEFANPKGIGGELAETRDKTQEQPRAPQENNGGNPGEGLAKQ